MHSNNSLRNGQMTITELHNLYLHFPNVTTDSRKISENCLFFALKGNFFDGNQFAKSALQQGAAYAVVDDPDVCTSDRYILVEDVLSTLQCLATWHRKTLKIPVIGITGTNGKTTTKELIAATLSRNYNLIYTEGNLNNQIGVPLTILRINQDHELAIIEMGASHIGDIDVLVRIAQPTHGLITNVGRAHLEGFGSFEGVVNTKCELYAWLKRTKGKVFLPKSQPVLAERMVNYDVITYGEGEDCYVCGKLGSSDPYLSFSWRQQGKENYVQTRLVGGYNLDNALAAVAVARFFKVPSARINRALESYEPTNHRSEMIEGHANKIIADAYNANPSSMEVAIKNFASMKGEIQNKVLILGAMKELGKESGAEHEKLVRMIETLNFRNVFLCGVEFEPFKNNFSYFPDTETLRAALKGEAFENKLILIKGSNSMKLSSLYELF